MGHVAKATKTEILCFSVVCSEMLRNDRVKGRLGSMAGSQRRNSETPDATIGHAVHRRGAFGWVV